MIRTLADIRDGLIAQPARLMLSLLAIVLGVLVLAVLFCLVGGIKHKAGAIVQELGVNVLAIMPNQQETLLQKEQIERIRAAFPDARVSGVKSWPVDTRDGETRLTVLASDAELIKVRPWKVVDGRFLDPRDVGEGRSHCVISRELSERMQWRVGQPLAISDHYFTIVGVLETGSSAVDSRMEEVGLKPGENLVVIPETVPPYWSNALHKPPADYDMAYVQLPPEVVASEAVGTCRAVLQLPADRVHRFSYVTPESLVLHLRKLQKTIQLSAGSLALLCLILGGTTLASLMIANVQERVREIGLRLALGATETSIAGLFILEAIMLTVVAGVAGTVFAHAVLYLYRGSLPVPVQMSSYTLFAPVGYALLFGVLFAWWPARRAAQIRPADALRNE